MKETSKIRRKGVVYSLRDAIARSLLSQKYTFPYGGIPKTDLSKDVQDILDGVTTPKIDLSGYYTKAEIDTKGFLTSYTETDPTVPAWAKQQTKPTYTASEVGALSADTLLFSGNYNDLSNKPSIPTTAGDIGALPANAYTTIQSNVNALQAKIDAIVSAISGMANYAFVNGKPSISAIGALDWSNSDNTNNGTTSSNN